MSSPPYARCARATRSARASLDGLVMGDAFGDSWFTLSGENVEQQWAARGLRPAPWRWTDDSAMAFVLFAHLAAHGEVRPGLLAREFAAEYARDSGRKYGASMHEVLGRIGTGEDWRGVTAEQFGGQGSYGNGAAMRVAPLGAWFRGDPKEAAAQARLSARATHAHPEAAAGAVAVAVAAALAAASAGRDAPLRAEFLREVAGHVPGSDVGSGLRVAADLPAGTSADRAASVLGSGWRISAPDTVPFALWSAAGHLDDLPEALWQTVGGWGDRDTTCAIAGGVVAARTGTGGVPADWLAAREGIPAWSGWTPEQPDGDRDEDGDRARDRDPANHYDGFAEAYSAENEDSLVNAHYERPAMLALAGEVAGRRILDAGCGSGPLTAALRDRGAVVTGIDVSSGMLALARRRLGEDADLRVADLRDRLPFADGAFDDVVASLVLHYLEDWGPTLAELRRVLKPGGRLIASVDHPFVAYTFQDPRPDYFATGSYAFDWTFGGRSVPMKFWRRSLHAMTDAFATAGFRLSVISEPQPDPAARELFPDGFHDLSSEPTFLFFVVEAPSSATAP